MNTTDNLYCLMLAGGKGRRLWPESRTEMPKQFIDFFGTGRTQVQQTYDRFREFLPADHIFVSTNIAYVGILKEQLPEMPDPNILAEPIWRNTAPSVAWGAHRIFHFNNRSTVVVAPSDHQIIDTGTFRRNVLTAAEFASTNETLLTMGVKPTRAEPGYGYLQIDKEVGENIYNVRSITEKPQREFAQVFLESGEFYWNTGIFIATTAYLLECFRQRFTSIFQGIDVQADSFTIEDENRYVMEHFPLYPNMAMESGIVEQARNVTVMKCGFGWSDLGSWHAIYEAEQKDGNGNVVLDSDVILEDAHGNIIKVPKGHLAVINGLSGYIVVEEGDTLLICPREDSSALIRKYSAEIEIRE